MPPLPRGIAEPLLETLSTTKVVLLQGARASGKTTLLTSLRAAGHIGSISDFSDPSARQAFSADPAGFLRALSQPAAIDEGQLDDGLLVALKQEVDGSPAYGQFIVTGSTRLATGELGGSHPLAGRSIPSLLRPMTQSERAGSPTESITRLFDGDPAGTGDAPGDLKDLQRRMIVGGLPSMPGVLRQAPTRSAREARSAYVDDVLRPLPGQPAHDHRALVRTFRYLAGQPAQILNKQRAAEHLELSRPTLTAYLNRLQAAYLIEEIPALRANEAASARAHPKVHVPDPGLAAWAAGMQTPDPTDVLGPLIESFVVHELLAQAAWSDLRPVARHWREPDAEVDLVLIDGSDRLVAVEVKASASVSNRDLRGITRLARRHPVHRGYVFYTGSRVVKLETDRWAVPISALWTSPSASPPRHLPALPAPRTPRPADAVRTVSTPATDALLFLSYVQADDKAEGGRIVRLAEDIASRYELQTGEPLPVFTDRDIGWGEEWKARLRRELLQTTFFVPIVTPRFLQSAACRAEVSEFVNAAAAMGTGEFVMPILYIMPPGFEETDDEVAVLLRNAQWEDWRELVYAERSSGEYRSAVDRLVRRLAAARQPKPRADDEGEMGGSDGAGDISEALETIEQLADLAPVHIDELVAGIEDLTTRLDPLEPRIKQAGDSPRRLRAVLRDAGRSLQGPAQALRRTAKTVREDLAALDRSIARVLAFASDGPSFFAGDVVDEIRALADGIDIDMAEVTELRQTMGQMAQFSRDLKPLADGFEEAFLVLDDLRAAGERWRRAARVLGSG